MLSLIRLFRRLGALALSVIIIAVSGCEKFDSRPENSPFLISVRTAQTRNYDAVIDVELTEGSINGQCTSTIVLYDERGRITDSRITFEDGSPMSANTKWTFGKDGKIRFVARNLSPGKYNAVVIVKRWFHSASGEGSFTIK